MSISSAHPADFSKIEEALKRNLLVTDKLEVVSKKSLQFLGRWLLRPLFALFGRDTLSCYRIPAVAKSILLAASTGTHEEKDRAFSIVNTLAAKTKNAQYKTEVLDLQQTDFNTGSPILQNGTKRPQLDAISQRIVDTVAQMTFNLVNTLEGSFVLSPQSFLPIFGATIKGTNEESKAKVLKALSIEPNAKDEAIRAITALEGQAKNPAINTLFVLATRNAASAKAARETGLETCESKKGLLKTTSVRTVVNGKVAETAPAFSELLSEKYSKEKEFADKLNLAAIHAISLNATMNVSVDQAATVQRDFTCADGTVHKEVPLLSIPQITARIHQATDCTLVELPIQEGSKVFVLPNAGVDFTTFNATLTYGKLQELRMRSVEAQVKLFIPIVNASDADLELDDFCEKTFLPEKLFGETPSGVMTAVFVKDEYKATSPKVTPDETSATTALELYIDKAFTWFIMDNSALPVIHGQVTDDTMIQLHPTPKKGWFW